MSIKLQLPKVTDLRPRITVIGVGGAGGNAINNMIAAGLNGVDFVVANTDAQALLASSAEHRIQLGVHLTEGLGAGSRPEIGEAAAEEAIEEIRTHIAGTHMVFVAAGMGGGTGTGAAAVIARIAKEEGVLVVGIVTKPFQFEGVRRQRMAEAGIAELKKHVDTLIVIPNQNLFRIANEKTTFAEAFVLADQVLYSGISCIVDLIIKEGLINLDFADVRTILSGMGSAMMGTGEASGDRRAILAAEEAIANPLLDDVSLKGAKGLLVSIIGGRNLTLYEVDEAASRVRQEVDPEANIIVGATFDDNIGDRLRVSIVASGMDAAARQAASTTTAPATQAPPAAATTPPPAVQLPAAKPPMQQAQQPSPPPLPPVHQTHPAAALRQPQQPAAPPVQDELGHRLSAAMAAGTEDLGGLEPEPDYDRDEVDSPQAIASAPWHAPGDVLIEEGLPQLTSAPAAPQGGQGRQSAAAPHKQTQPQPPAGFTPAPPHEIRRAPQRRMPELEDFPAVGQRDYRAKAPSAAAPQQREMASEERRKPGLLERLTGRGRRADPPPAPQSPPPMQRESERTAVRAPVAPPGRSPPPSRIPTATPEPAPQRRVASGGQAVELPVFFDRNGKS
jgi:cell division protein FtsZ